MLIFFSCKLPRIQEGFAHAGLGGYQMQDVCMNLKCKLSEIAEYDIFRELWDIFKNFA